MSINSLLSDSSASSTSSKSGMDAGLVGTANTMNSSTNSPDFKVNGDHQIHLGQHDNDTNGSIKSEYDTDALYTNFQKRINTLLELEDMITHRSKTHSFLRNELKTTDPFSLSKSKLLLEFDQAKDLKSKILHNEDAMLDKLIKREKLLMEFSDKEAVKNGKDLYIRAPNHHMNGNGYFDQNNLSSPPPLQQEYYISHGGRRIKKPVTYYDEIAYENNRKRKIQAQNGGNNNSNGNKRRLVVTLSSNGSNINSHHQSHTDNRRGGSSRSKKKEELQEPIHYDDPSTILTFTAPIPLPQPKRLAKEQRAINKQYDNVYLSIWKDLSRKDGPRIYRLLLQAQQTKLVNLKKTAMLAAREAKRWQFKTNKSQKDVQSKARRSMREMFNFWKKNEREERELRKKAEKEAMDKVKKEEEEREAKRQSRKLNFLITQTELYSHFIGKKIKTDELEGDMGDKSLKPQDNLHHNDPIDMMHARNDFSSIDFDQDEDSLRKTAAANAHTAMMEAQQRAQQFNELPKDTNADDENEMNFQNPTSLGDINIEQPKLLTCTLKEYQVKGLNWLANLYDQGINGILADEMGLGKTVQSISVLAYLAETHNIWGPFLVVTPASTLHNWQQEISKFVPDFKVLPYWGSAKDRKVLRKFWDRKKIVYDKNSPFHVVVTSYQLVVTDAQYFQRMKWQYMILDEAQAIKSSQSSRWKVLLSFACRNRLLLTGTPIQNSMQELWALLHFIMPSLFDSHDEFSEWFSKDIESHAQSNTQLNEQQLRRLHMILKPFMLRRIKKNVQSELGDKIEIDLYCNLTNRQKKLYQMVKSQISLMDLMDKLRGDTGNNKKNNDEEESTESLMNLVMQFRKVCNHPDLFERADTKSAFAFNRFAETASFLREKNDVDLIYSSRNEIDYNLPRLIYDQILLPNLQNNINDKQWLCNEKLNIWSSHYIKEHSNSTDAFTWSKFIDQSANEIARTARNDLFTNAISLQNYTGDFKGDILGRLDVAYDDDENVHQPLHKLFLLNDQRNINRVKTNMDGELRELYSTRHTVYEDMYLNVMERSAFEPVLAPPVELECSSRNFEIQKENTLFNPQLRKALMPLSMNTEYDLMCKKVPFEQFPKSKMLPEPLNNKVGYSTIHLPSMKRFIIESGKLNQLDSLLQDLKANDHKVLIYFQMTRMMDLMEEYLKYKQYKYIRLDGSSKLSDRRDLVHDWQTRPELFIFLLSTRAGGLGINLTAADTVVFYDSDWNPTIDSQAMDRAHRLGQTRQVTVYRLLVKGTIEERMRDRAKQKEHVQQVVMEGKAASDTTATTTSAETSTDDKTKRMTAAQEKKKEVAMLLLDD